MNQITNLFERLFYKKSIASALLESDSANQLKKELNVKDLTLMGVAAIIGAGIFGISDVTSSGGPAIALLFLVLALCFACCGYCYAALASSVPASGSAYTYAYVALGELIALDYRVGFNHRIFD